MATTARRAVFSAAMSVMPEPPMRSSRYSPRRQQTFDGIGNQRDRFGFDSGGSSTLLIQQS
jgi:hypothetical protein